MAKQCPVCEKIRNRAWRRVKLRGKFNPTTKRSQQPNLQWVILNEKSAKKAGLTAGERIKACAKCIKAQGKKPRVRKLIAEKVTA